MWHRQRAVCGQSSAVLWRSACSPSGSSPGNPHGKQGPHQHLKPWFGKERKFSIQNEYKKTKNFLVKKYMKLSSPPPCSGGRGSSVDRMVKRSWVRGPLWRPARYWLGRCQYSVTDWDRSHGLPTMSGVWQHVNSLVVEEDVKKPTKQTSM